MAGVTCVYSGCEGQQHYDVLIAAGVRQVLTSYYQFYQGDTKAVARRKALRPDMQFMIDSGAHTFLTDETGKFANWTRTDYENYVDGYVKWLWDNRHAIRCAVELDIEGTINRYLGGSNQSQIGNAIVETWQRDLFMPLTKKGMEIIYVWHPERGMDNWEEMCAKYPYVGLPGAYSKRGDFNKFVSIARRYATRMHGFAATSQRDFRDCAWYTIDSITWKGAEMYGVMMDWNEKSQRLTFNEKTKRNHLRAKMLANGFDADACISGSDYRKVTEFSLWSMRQMELFYQKAYSNRIQYWEVRLPVLSRLQKATDQRLKRWVRLLRFDDCFKDHAHKGIAEQRKLLYALCCVQYGDRDALVNNPVFLDHLRPYFDKLVTPLTLDMRSFQRELSIRVSPPNPPPQIRQDVEHYTLVDTAPKLRPPVEFTLEELTYDPTSYPLLAELLGESSEQKAQL